MDVETTVSSAETPVENTEQIVVESPTEQSRAEEGLIQGFQAEREKRQLAEQRAQLLEQMMYNQQNQQHQQPTQLPDYAPDDLVTVRTAEQILEQRLGKIEQQNRERLLNTQVEMMRNKVGKQEYDEVIDLFKRTASPSMINVVMSSDNPAELAFQLGSSQPEYQRKVNDKATKAITSKVSANLDKPQTLNNMSGSSPQFVTKDYSNMSDAEIDREARKIKGF